VRKGLRARRVNRRRPRRELALPAALWVGGHYRHPAVHRGCCTPPAAPSAAAPTPRSSPPPSTQPACVCAHHAPAVIAATAAAHAAEQHAAQPSTPPGALPAAPPRSRPPPPPAAASAPPPPPPPAPPPPRAPAAPPAAPSAPWRTRAPPPIDAPCTQRLRHGDPIHASKALTAAAASASPASSPRPAAAAAATAPLRLPPCMVEAEAARADVSSAPASQRSPWSRGGSAAPPPGSDTVGVSRNCCTGMRRSAYPDSTLARAPHTQRPADAAAAGWPYLPLKNNDRSPAGDRAAAAGSAGGGSAPHPPPSAASRPPRARHPPPAAARTLGQRGGLRRATTPPSSAAAAATCAPVNAAVHLRTLVHLAGAAPSDPPPPHAWPRPLPFSIFRDKNRRDIGKYQPKWPRPLPFSIFRDKNRRRIRQSQPKRPPIRTQRPSHPPQLSSPSPTMPLTAAPAGLPPRADRAAAADRDTAGLVRDTRREAELCPTCRRDASTWRFSCRRARTHTGPHCCWSARVALARQQKVQNGVPPAVGCVGVGAIHLPAPRRAP
jgi:hypothetical protein